MRSIRFFKKGKLISLTETAKLDPKDEIYFTNLLALYSVNKKLKPLFKKKPGSEDWDEINVKAFKKIVFDFYDFIFHEITEYKAYFLDKTLSLKTTRDRNTYLLFRPVGLVLLARLYVHFKKSANLPKFKRTVNKIGFIMPTSPYNKVLWDDGKMEAKMASQTIAYNLSLYILKEYPEGDTQNLLKKYREITKNSRAKLPKPIVTR